MFCCHRQSSCVNSKENRNHIYCSLSRYRATINDDRNSNGGDWNLWAKHQSFFRNKNPNLHSFTQISLPKECLNYSEEPWIGEVIYLSWPPFLDTSKKSWLFGYLWNVTISYNGQQWYQNVQISRKSGIYRKKSKSVAKMNSGIVAPVFWLCVVL